MQNLKFGFSAQSQKPLTTSNAGLQFKSFYNFVVADIVNLEAKVKNSLFFSSRSFLLQQKFCFKQTRIDSTLLDCIEKVRAKEILFGLMICPWKTLMITVNYGFTAQMSRHQTLSAPD